MGRTALAMLLCAAALVAAAAITPARAQTCLVDVLGIAVVEPVAATEEAKAVARDIADLIAGRLESDALFARIPAEVFPQGPQDIRGRPNWLDWRRVRADILMTGDLVLLSNGEYEFRFRVWDIRFEREITNIVTMAPGKDWDRVADALHTTLTERVVDVAATRCRPPEGQRANPFRRLTA